MSHGLHCDIGDQKCAENIFYFIRHSENLRRQFALYLRPTRDVAQVVEYTSGGRVVAGSSPVIPTDNSKGFQFIGSLCCVEKVTCQ